MNLNQEISFNALRNRSNGAVAPGAMPTKRTINLAQTAAVRENRVALLVAFAAVVLLILIGAKYLVVNPLANSYGAQADVLAAQSELDRLRQSNQDYEAVQQDYSKYVLEGITEEETSTVDRSVVLSLVDDYLFQVGSLRNLSLSGNELTATVVDASMSEVSSAVKKIQADDRVQYVTVSTAQNKESSTSVTTATIVITFASLSQNADASAAQEADAANDELAETLLEG